MKFGEKLKSIRIGRGWTQQEMADILGTSKQSICRYERSDRDPSLNTAKEFAAKLNVHVDALANDALDYVDLSRIKQERELQGYSPEDFAFQLGITPSRLLSIESGDCIPTIYEVYDIAEKLCFSIDALTGFVWPFYDAQKEKSPAVHKDDEARRWAIAFIDQLSDEDFAVIHGVLERFAEKYKTP